VQGEVKCEGKSREKGNLEPGEILDRRNPEENEILVEGSFWMENFLDRGFFKRIIP
jgi:hypothetical protein